MKLLGGLFGTEASPVEIAQQSIEKVTAKCDRIRTQLLDTERALGASKEVAADHAASGYNIDDLSHDIASEEAACGALKTALARAEAELRDAEQALADAEGIADRERSIGEINSIIAAIDEPLQRLLAALADLTGAVKRGADVSLDAQSLRNFLEMCSAELPAAAAATCTGLKHLAAQIELGSASARLPKPEAKPPTVAPTPQPITISVVTKHDIKFTNAEGVVCYCKQFWDAGLPSLVAERAIAHGVVCCCSLRRGEGVA
jgi:hypothetical protein